MIKNENLKESSLYLIQTNLKFTLLNLIYDLSLEDEVYVYKPPEDILDTRKEIIEYTKALPKYFKLPFSDRKEIIARLYSLKNKALESSKGIYSYSKFTEKITLMLKNEMLLKQVKDTEKMPYDTNAVVADCMEYVRRGENDFMNSILKSEILTLFPMRFTKANFSDYIKNSFQLLFKGLTKSTCKKSLEIFKLNISINEHKNEIPLLYDKLNELFLMDYSSLPLATLREYFEDIQQTHSNIEVISELAKMNYNNINYLISLYTFVIDENYLFDDDIQTKDIFYTTCENAGCDSLEAFRQTIQDTVEDKIDSFFDNMMKSSQEFKKEISKKDISSLDSDIQTCLNTLYTIENNFNMELYDELLMVKPIDENTPPEELTDGLFIDSLVTEFIDFMNCSFENIPPKKSKFIKQIFLQGIPCPLSDKDFEDKLASILNNEGDSDIAYVTLSDLMELFSHMENHHEHHHHEHCDCGEHHHEHHHHEHCDCGEHHHHEHHHHEHCDCGEHHH